MRPVFVEVQYHVKKLVWKDIITFDEAVDALLQQGQGDLLVKRDLKDALRHVPVASLDQGLLGFFCDD